MRLSWHGSQCAAEYGYLTPFSHWKRESKSAFVSEMLCLTAVVYYQLVLYILILRNWDTGIPTCYSLQWTTGLCSHPAHSYWARHTYTVHHLCWQIGRSWFTKAWTWQFFLTILFCVISHPSSCTTMYFITYSYLEYYISLVDWPQ